MDFVNARKLLIDFVNAAKLLMSMTFAAETFARRNALFPLGNADQGR